DHRRRIERRVAELLVLSASDVVLILSSGCPACPCEESETTVVVIQPNREARTMTFSQSLDKISDRDIIAAIDRMAS
ncbi:MAG: hypothetical protein KIT48_08345, partial [Pseudolabrys sp.]|nr:hypothetical protein [Pseudolabrys sp.]